MKLVIDIDEKEYIEICEEPCTKLGLAIANGTPLPKGYGNLIDKDKLLDELEKTVKSVDDTNKHFLSWDRAVAHVHLSKPIIKADGGGEDD